MKKRIVSVVLVFACALSLFCGCSKENKSNNENESSDHESENDHETKNTGLDDVILWGMPGTEKVYQDIGYDSDYYTSYKTDARIDLVMAKGEYEGGQIIISANSDVTFDVSGSALTSGENSIAASQVEVFAQKYVNVSANNDLSSKLPVAKYPDALIPMENLKAVGENVVREGENQGIYVRVKTSADQAPGEYTGSLTLTVGEESTQLPVKVQVADVAVSQEAHNKSVFINAWYFYEGELDTTQEMLDKYNEALLDYRIGMGTMLMYGRHHNEDLSTPEKIDAWLEKAYGYMQDPACSTIQLPYTTDEAQMTVILQAIADYSVEKNYDMFAKLVVYPGGLIDEPRGNGTMADAERICSSFMSLKNTFADTLPSDGLQAEMADSVRKIPMLVTEYYDEKLDSAGATFCPQFQHYDTENQRRQYEGREGWWYGCIYPRAPFPTYHTDDTWLSARLIGWMQAQYNVVGNLFWSTDVYAVYSKDGYQSIEEYYEGEAVRYPAVNGDGYLFYPGKKYGIDGPIGSMRLEAIRDGYEEYEILYEIKQRYLDTGNRLSSDELDFGKFVSSLTEDMYTGTTVAVTTDEFNTARLALLEASVLNKETEFAVLDYSDNGYGEKTYKFVVNSDWKVQEGGAVLTPETTQENLSVYSITRKLENDRNELCLSFEKDGKKREYTLDLGGRTVAVYASEFDESIFEERTAKLDLKKTGDGWEITLAEVADADASEQSFALVGESVSAVDTNTRSMVLHMQYDGDDNAAFTLNGKFANSKVATALASYTLEKGENTITVDLSLKDMQSLGVLEKLTFVFNGDEGAASIPAHTITLKDIVYYAE